MLRKPAALLLFWGQDFFADFISVEYSRWIIQNFKSFCSVRKVFNSLKNLLMYSSVITARSLRIPSPSLRLRRRFRNPIHHFLHGRPFQCWSLIIYYYRLNCIYQSLSFYGNPDFARSLHHFSRRSSFDSDDCLWTHFSGIIRNTVMDSVLYGGTRNAIYFVCAQYCRCSISYFP